MKKQFPLHVLLFTLLLMFTACSANPSSGAHESNPEPVAQKYSREYWGEWKKMDQTETWEINSTSIKVNGETITKDVILAKPSENVISVTDGKITYCLYAIRTASSLITGSVESADGSKGIGGWLPVVVQNINDRFDVTETTTNVEGIFSADRLIPGDDYRITIGDTSLTVKPSFDGEDIGNITLRSGVNFKVTVSNSNNLMFAGSQYYSMDLIIENIGDTNCTAASYTLTGDDGLEVINNYSEGVLLRTVAAGEKKTIPLRVRCDVPKSKTTIKKLNLSITDKDGETWNDSVSLKFYKETVTVNVVSEKNRPISGVIIGDGRTYTVTNETNYSVVVPATEEGYLLVFSGAIANAARNTECAYSIGIDTSAVSANNLLSELGSDVSSYEPNDNEKNAKSIYTGEAIVSYLFENDIDYYLLSSPHNWDEGVVITEATCTQTGSIVYTCYDCGETKVEIIPCHSFSSEWSSDETYHWHDSTCGHDVVDGKATHIWNEGTIIKQPTCTERGTKICSCIICGITKEEAVPQTGHSFSSEWSSDETYHWHDSTCGHDVVDGKANHIWDEGVITKKPTTTTKGVRTFTCTVCGKIKTESVPVLVYSIGDIGPAGGYVFYDKGSYSDGWRYLEAAPSDLEERYKWGTISSLYSLVTSTDIGKGKTNTNGIVNCCTNASETAANACLEYSVNGYDDWFLPSKDELKLMYTNLYANGIGGFVPYTYWSSSIYSNSSSYSSSSWRHGFGTNDPGASPRYDKNFVRPIRAF